MLQKGPLDRRRIINLAPLLLITAGCSNGEDWQPLAAMSDESHLFAYDANSVRAASGHQILKYRMDVVGKGLEGAKTESGAPVNTARMVGLLRFNCDDRTMQFIQEQAFMNGELQETPPDRAIEVVTPNSPGEEMFAIACE